jgi:NAD(P)-dependent dehydrogenase (short-subunit alcohol dehydrogenase family)
LISDRFQDKVALVTGGNAGIGRAACIAFAREGARVVVAARRENTGKEVVDAIKKEGGEAVFIKTDVSRPQDIETLFKTALDKYGRLDCAVNNAGVSSPALKRFINYTMEEWDWTMNINLRGVWLCMQHEIRQMLAQGGGAIVNTASIAGVMTDFGLSVYCASKHGVMGLTKSAALEYAHKNIRVNAICPGYIQTPMLEEPWQTQPQIKDALLATIPMHRFGKPEEIASAILWMCSDDAAFMTGKEMLIGGGQTIQA